MISRYDYLNIAIYIAFIIGIGIFYSRKSKNTSDYFRGGGVMPWWITGTAAWMGSFSAWTFTGAAGKIYETGPYVLVLYAAGLPALFVLLGFTCYRFRRMRVVTPLEAVRLRFGLSSQQFYTWIRLPFLLFFGGVALTSVSVFMAAVFGVDLTTMIMGLGLVVMIVSMLGGTFAVAASDFVQMFLVVSVTIVTSVLALSQTAVGGLSGLMEKVPAQHFHWGEIARPEFILLWMLALTVNNILGQNSMENSAKYLMTRSDRHARLMLIIPIAGTILGPLIWIIPPMVTAVTHPDLHQMFPQLNFPHEAAFLATAHDVLPQGMLGLLICGIFAATLTGMDSSLNQAAGIFVRNFYLPILNPDCPEKKLLGVSKLCTAVFGIIIITIGVIFSKYRSLGLFDLLNQLGVSLWLPLAIPLFIGLFYKRTPAWSTWSTVLIGLGTAQLINRFSSGIGTSDEVTKTIHWMAVNAQGVPFTVDSLKLAAGQGAAVFYAYDGPSWFGWLPGMEGLHLREEVTSLALTLTVGVVLAMGTAWFFFTSIFYEKERPAYKADVEEFFGRLRAPLVKDKDVEENATIEMSIGRLCLIYGGIVTAMAAIPNGLVGRLCFVFCGGVMLAMGGFLVWHYKVKTTVSSRDVNS